MDTLRTVTVLEHEVIPIFDETATRSAIPTPALPWLTEADAQAMSKLNELRPGFCQRIFGGMKVAQYCGIVRLPTCVFEVLPKIGMTDARAHEEIEYSRGALLCMLRNAEQLALTGVATVQQRAVQAPLLDIFIEAFLHCALEQAHRGLLSRYVQYTDDAPVLKGRFNINGHLRRNFGRPHLIHCDYDEFTLDNAYNRAVRCTLNTCQNWVRGSMVQRLWFETHTRFAGIASATMSAAQVALLPRDRTTHRYASVLKWCEWLLAMNSPSMSAGTSQAPGLLFDMNKLFEAHVCTLEENAAGDDYAVYRQGPIKALATRNAAEAFMLKPDITVWHNPQKGPPIQIARVLDAKWKRLDPQATNWGIDQSDIYQLLAYAVRYGCRRLELIYPEATHTVDAEVLETTFTILAGNLGGSSIEICIRTLPLWATGYRRDRFGVPTV